MNQERLMKVDPRAGDLGEGHARGREEPARSCSRSLPDATKAEIKAAVELLFKEQKVEVGAVNVVNVKGKEKRHGRFIGRAQGRQEGVREPLGEGDINFVEGVA